MMSTLLRKGWIALSVLLVCFAFSCAFGVVTASANDKVLIASTNAAIDEQEPNDSFATATRINMNQWVYGHNDGQYKKFDYYEVNLPVSGSVKVTFVNDEHNDDIWPDHTVYLYDQYYDELGSLYVGISSTKPMSKSFGLKKGINRLRIGYTNGSMPEGQPYRFILTYNIPTTTISKVIAGKRSFNVKWVKKSGATSYQIRYSKNKNMSKAKTITVSGKSGAKTIAKLTGKKKYYVQIRVIKRIGAQTYYSSWSSKKSITTKK